MKTPKNLESIYETLVERMNEAFWMTDPDGITLYTNPKFCDMVGYLYEDLIGKPSYDLWDDISANRIRAIDKHQRKQGIASNYEANLKTKSGKIIPVLVSGSPIDGGTIGIMTDLREIQKKDSIYKTLVENMNEAVCMGDENEKTLYANPKFCEMMGYSLEETLGRESYDFWETKSAEKVRTENEQRRKKGISSSYEGQLKTKSGKLIPVLSSGTPLPEGGTIGIMTDLRELKQKESTEKMLTQAIEHANDAIIIFDKNRSIKSWNTGAKIIFGFKKEAILGKPLDLIFPEDEIKLQIQVGKKQSFETNGIHKNKHTVRTSVTFTPIFIEKKKHPDFYLLIARDISGQKKIEEELALKYEKIRDAYNKLGITRRQMDYMFDLLEFAQNTEDIKSLGNFVVSSIIMLTRVDACCLRQYNPKKDSLDIVSCFGFTKDWLGQSSIKAKNSLTQKAFQKKKPLKIIDLSQEPQYHAPHLAKKHNFSSLLVIPLKFQSQFLGSLTLYTTPEKKLEIFENDFIEKYAHLIGMVMVKLSSTSH